ncbi:MAG TPA: hypothetical protein VF132_05115 [Rudaea sp.]
MVFGMTTLTFVHVLLSVLGIVSGFVVLFFGFYRSRPLAAWTAFFLIAMIATTLTGFGFARDHVMPSHGVGVASFLALVIAVVALYGFRLARGWRRIYVLSTLLALYLNVFVLIVQAYQKVPRLQALAPTQTEPVFVITQAVALVVFLVLGTLAVKRFQYRPS